MKDDSELQIDDSWSDASPYPAKRRRIESGSSKSLHILLIILLVVVFGGAILYFLGKGSSGGEAGRLQSKVITLEQRIAGLEKQLAELQGKIATLGPDSGLLQRVEALDQKVEALEKQPTAESKAKPSPSPKPAVSIEKQYHTVQKGETLYRIGKKYGISVEELRKLNNLSSDQPLHTGQKLQVSPGH